MLVIKMLKKASNMNNIELAEYLNKTRNTIASWENYESNIPNTEKIKLSNRFNFDYEYWDIGLDRTTAFYQKMYSDIKNGYLNDSRNQSLNNESRIDEILKYCDGTNGVTDSYKFINESNEYNHCIYINSLLNGIDPIDNSKLADNHFINNYKMYFNDFYKTLNKLKHGNIKDNDSLDLVYEYYLNKLKKWRLKQAIVENVKTFQILSDDVLENIVKAYKNNNRKLSGIKNFPINGLKWSKYYEIIINILDKEEC